MGVLQDLLKGDFPAVWEDIVKGFQRLPQPVQSFIGKAETDLGTLASSLAQTAFQDVVTGGFTTASFITAGKDVLAKGLEQGQTILMSDAMAFLNMLASEWMANQAPVVAPVAAVEAPVEEPAAV
jgi:hypothetical protein